ncbi:MAG TPA: Ig-like domain-containing protein [Actinomycetota bacterium]
MSLSAFVSRGNRAKTAVVLAIAGAVVAGPIVRSDAAIGAPTIATPAPGAIRAAGNVAFQGTAAPGANVEVFRSTGSLGRATANASGIWNVSAPLGDGTYSVYAIASDGLNQSPASEIVTFDVDGVRPSANITAPEDEHLFGPGETPEIAGTASDDRRVHAIKLEYWLLNRVAGAFLADCASCGSSRNVSWTHRPDLGDGTYAVKVWAYDAAGSPSLAQQVSYTALATGVDLTTPDLPTDVVPVPEVTEPSEGETAPGAAEPVTFAGTTEPGSTVEVVEETEYGTLGTAADEDGDGRWSFDVRLPTGTYQIRAFARDEDGNLSAPTEIIGFTVDAQTPLLFGPEENTVILPLQQTVLSGEASDNFGIAGVVLEYWQAGTLVLRDLAECPGCASGDGSWTHEPTLPGGGVYDVRAWAIDLAGNGSAHEAVTLITTGV